MNSNIKPTFLNYIAGLDQAALVGILNGMVNNGMVTARSLQSVLNVYGVEVPAEVVDQIVGHNIKALLVTYCSNYNGCDIEVLETIDGTDPGEYTESEGFNAIKEQLVNAVVDHAVDECGEEGNYYGSIECLEEDVEGIMVALLGEEVEVQFAEDSMST